MPVCKIHCVKWFPRYREIATPATGFDLYRRIGGVVTDQAEQIPCRVKLNTPNQKCLFPINSTASPPCQKVNAVVWWLWIYDRRHTYVRNHYVPVLDGRSYCVPRDTISDKA